MNVAGHGWRRRGPGSGFALGLLLLLVAGAGAAERLRLNATAPLGLWARPGGVAAVAVELETPGPVEASLVVTSNATGGDQVVQPVKVGAGRFRFEVPYPVPVNASGLLLVTVTLLADRRTLDPPQVLRFDTPVPEPDGPTLEIGWVAQTPPPKALERLPEARGAATEPGKLAEPERAAEDIALPVLPWQRGPRRASGYRPWYSHTLSPKRLPEDWRLFIGHDLLIVAAGAGRQLTPAQVEALDHWVRAGGRLLLGTDSLPPGCEQTPFAQAFQPPTGKSGAFAAREERGLGGIHRAALRLDEGLSQGPAAVAEAVASTGLLQLVKRRPQMEEELLGRWGGSALEQTVWAGALEPWINLERFSYRAILLFAVLFLLIAGVLEPLVLRRLRRAHWTWVVLALVVVGFCGVAFAIQRVSRGYRSRLASIALHDYGLGGGGVHRTVSCLIPASGRTRHLQPPGSRALTGRYLPNSDTARAVADNSRGALTVTAPAWSPVFLSTLAAHDETPPFAAELVVENGQLRGTVRILRPELRPTWLVVTRGQLGWAGECAAGADRLTIAGGSALDVERVLHERFARAPYLLLSPAYEERVRRGWGWDNEQNLEMLVAATVVRLGDVAAPDVGGWHQFLAPRTDDDAYGWLLAVCERGPELEVSGPLKRQQVHLVRQRVQVQAGVAPPGVAQ